MKHLFSSVLRLLQAGFSSLLFRFNKDNSCYFRFTVWFYICFPENGDGCMQKIAMVI